MSQPALSPYKQNLHNEYDFIITMWGFLDNRHPDITQELNVS